VLKFQHHTKLSPKQRQGNADTKHNNTATVTKYSQHKKGKNIISKRNEQTPEKEVSAKQLNNTRN
jgi:hypothetical protein